MISHRIILASTSTSAENQDAPGITGIDDLANILVNESTEPPTSTDSALSIHLARTIELSFPKRYEAALFHVHFITHQAFAIEQTQIFLISRILGSGIHPLCIPFNLNDTFSASCQCTATQLFTQLEEWIDFILTLSQYMDPNDLAAMEASPAARLVHTHFGRHSIVIKGFLISVPRVLALIASTRGYAMSPGYEPSTLTSWTSL